MNNTYHRNDSKAFATKIGKKIEDWYTSDPFYENALRKIVLQREEIYTLMEKVKKVCVKQLLKYLDSSGFFYRPSSPDRHHNFPGGLAGHSLGTFRIVEEWNKMTPDERRKSELYRKFLSNKQFNCDIFTEKADEDDMVIAAICHDLCKAKHYYFKGRAIKSHNSDSEPRTMHSRLSVKRLEENGITQTQCEELLLAVLTHMRLYSKPRSEKEAKNQNKGRSSMLAVVVWAADKLDASRYPAGTRH